MFGRGKNYLVMQKLDPVKVSWIIRAKENGAKNADVAPSMKDITVLGTETMLMMSQFRKHSSIKKVRQTKKSNYRRDEENCPVSI